MMWDFSRLPEDEALKEEIREAIKDKDLETLAKVERKYKLSNTFYCCPSESHLKWFKYGEREGHFS